MSWLPSIRNKEHPFNAWQKRAAPIAVVVLVGLVVFAQYFTRSMRDMTLSEAPAYLVADEEAEDPGVGALTVMSKDLVKWVRSTRVLPELSAGVQPDAPDGEIAQAISRELENIEHVAITRTERLRLAIVEGEMRGPAVALKRLEALQREVDSEGELARDIGWLIPHYQMAAKGTPGQPPAEGQAALRERHGWFGDLALSMGLPREDGFRQQVTGGAHKIAALEIVLTFVTLAALLVGTILLIIAIRRYRSEEYDETYESTDVPRVVYLETFGVFMTAFMGVVLLDVLLVEQRGAWVIGLRECGLWACSLAVLWPLLRGVTWDELRTDVGLTRGRGLWSEFVTGVGAFLVSMPISVGVGIITAILMGQHESAGPPGIPMFQQPVSPSWAMVILGAAGAIVWAPLVEEMLFRGALQGALPMWARAAGRIGLTAVIFGIVHPYEPAGLVQVAVTGVIFGVLREWRGSLLAGIVCHALHNGAIELASIGQLVALN